MIFSKANLAVGHVASQNEHDRGLNCIHLNPDGSTVAANQKVMMAVGPLDPSRAQFPDVGEQVSPPAPVGLSIPLDMLDKVLKNLPRSKGTNQNVALTRNRDRRMVEITTHDMRHEQRVAGMPASDPFPLWGKMLQRVRGTDSFKVCINRRDLIHLLTALEEACPDRGGENPVYLEINPAGTGMVLRCVNRETGQRAIGGITAYNTGGHWLPTDKWEQEVFESKTAVKIIKKQAQ